MPTWRSCGSRSRGSRIAWGNNLGELFGLIHDEAHILAAWQPILRQIMRRDGTSVRIGYESRNFELPLLATEMDLVDSIAYAQIQIADLLAGTIAYWLRGYMYPELSDLFDEVLNPQEIELLCRVNGETLQASSTDKMIFGVATLISYISQTITLEPRDVLETGTPSGVGFAWTPPIFLRAGEVVECEVEGIGILRNSVVVD